MEHTIKPRGVFPDCFVATLLAMTGIGGITARGDN